MRILNAKVLYCFKIKYYKSYNDDNYFDYCFSLFTKCHFVVYN